MHGSCKYLPTSFCSRIKPLVELLDVTGRRWLMYVILDGFKILNSSQKSGQITEGRTLPYVSALPNLVNTLPCWMVPISVEGLWNNQCRNCLSPRNPPDVSIICWHQPSRGAHPARQAHMTGQTTTTESCRSQRAYVLVLGLP